MKKLKVLVIPSWYPNKADPLWGNYFIKQASALNEFADVTMLHIERVGIKEINTYFPRCAYDEVSRFKINGFVIQTIDVGNRTFANYKGGVHCLILGTTGSGKTIRFVIPTMQFLARSALKPSIVVTDPKGELYFSQSKLYQERGYEVLTLNLREPLKRSSCWNPWHIAYEEYQEGLKQKELIKDLTKKFPNIKSIIHNINEGRSNHVIIIAYAADGWIRVKTGKKRILKSFF